jgi:hypothetical protein
MMQSPPATVPMTVPQFMLSLRQQVADAADLRMAIDVQTNRIALTLAVHDALNPPRLQDLGSTAASTRAHAAATRRVGQD